MKIVKTIVAASLLMASTAFADRPSVHGMLLFGNKATYASHLPMFHTPHDYQLIFKLSLQNSEQSVLKKYEDAKKGGHTLFTIEPEVMDLTKLMDGSKTSFQATLYKGHFERGGQALGLVTIVVDKIVVAKKLKGNQTATINESYLVFGSEGEYFSAHVIKSKPSYDNIAQVSQPFDHDNFCTRVSCTERGPVTDSLLPVTVFAAKSVPAAGDQLGESDGMTVEVLKPIYHETGDLSH